jgi:hypothetical protein
MSFYRILLLAALLPAAWAAEKPKWKPLFNGVNLDGWEIRGECIWNVMPGGILLGYRAHPNPSKPFPDPWPISSRQYGSWLYRQAWLYTKAEFAEYDLHLEYFIPSGGNSGISIRDRSRAHSAIGEADDKRPELAQFPKTTPAHIGYEIQICDTDEKYSSGSIYSIVPAKTGLQRKGDWNAMDIESRTGLIRIKINGQVAAEGPGEAERSKTGPIGLQLHDQFSFMMFRNIKIKELGR